MTRRYGYTLSVAEDSTEQAVFSVVRSVDVDLETMGLAACEERLRGWAVEWLERHRAEPGLYHAEFGSRYDDGEVDKCIRQLYVPWTGDQALTVAPEDQPARRRPDDSGIVSARDRTATLA